MEEAEAAVFFHKLFGNKFAGGANVFLGCVEAFDYGNSYKQFDIIVGKILYIFENSCVVDTGARLVDIGIHMLYIGDPIVGIGKNLINGLAGNIKRGFDAGSYSVGLAKLEKLRHKICLQQGLSAGDGNTAAGLVIVSLVLLYKLERLINSVNLAPRLDAAAGAGIGTCHAVLALVSVDRYQLVVVYHVRYAVLAAFFTPAALIETDTFIGINSNLTVCVDALGIAAPFAVEGTTFHEQLRTDTGTVMNGKGLYIEYSSGQY